MSEFRLVYTTWPDAESARTAARKLLDERLIACANLLAGVESIYRWQGEVESSGEVVLLLKTLDDHVPAVMQHIGAFHPYEVPCIIELHVGAVTQPFLNWVTDSVAPDRQ